MTAVSNGAARFFVILYDIYSVGVDLLNISGSVVLNEKFGFFEISSPKGFTISNPSDEFNVIAGRNTEGLNYADMVCPKDRDSVSEKLLGLFETDNNFEECPRINICMRHRISFPDGSIGVVMLTASRERDEYLRCSVIRVLDDFAVRPSNVYKSNSVLESFAISMAVLEIIDGTHFIVKCANSCFYDLIGWNRLELKEFFNECIDDAIFADDFDFFSQQLRSLGDGLSECVFEVRTITVDGGTRFNEVHARYLASDSGCPVISTVFEDITERKKLRRELVVKNERFSIIQENADQIVFDYDAESDVCVFTGNLSRIKKHISFYGMESNDNELVVNDFFGSQFALGMMSKKDYALFCDAFANAIIYEQDGEAEFFLSFIGQPAGAWYRFIFSAVKGEGDDVVRIVGRIKNIEKQKRTEALIEKRIKLDMLTGLLNKDTAIDSISEFLKGESENWHEDEKYHALMIIDIDNFHTINEFFGHTFGDDVIREFASDIKSSFRDTDIVGRIGGDEFIVLMKSVTLKFAAKKAGRLCRGLVKNYGVQNRITLSCSIGMAFFGKDAFDFDSLYQYADWAMYNAKTNGRCSYCIYDSETHDDYRRIEELNNRTCMDPPGNSTEVSELDTNLMDIAFSLVSASDDIYGTLEILLRTVGRKYNLSAVSVLAKKYDEDDKLVTVSRWLSNRNLFKGHRSPMVTGRVDLAPIFKGSSLKCVSDISASNLCPALKSNLKNDGIYSFVMGKLEGRSGEHYGCVMFMQFNRTRKWSRKEVNTFKYISKIVSVALVERYSARTLLPGDADNT